MVKIIPILPDAVHLDVLASTSSSLVFSTLPPLSLYIHVPWCVQKCPYCDFNSHAAPSDIPETQYLQALLADLERALPQIWGRRIVSIFIGGGTPSLLSERLVDQLLSALRSRLIILPEAEITLEANPGTVDAGRFKGYHASGVNRLSLGVQSFNDQHLQALGRIHNADQARKAADMAMQVFPRVNFDLMIGLPAQTPSESEHDLRQAVQFSPEHLSVYQLTLEPNTVFAKYPPTLPEDAALEQIQLAVDNVLSEQGYMQYEVSAFARQPTAQSMHNRNYWEFGDYLGIGPGAHSKITMPDRIIRQERWKQPEKWLQQAVIGQAVREQNEVSHADLPFEFMMNALRLREGVPTNFFSARTGLPFSRIRPVVERLQVRGLVHPYHRFLQTTPQGFRFLNDVLEAFLQTPEEL